MSRLYPKAKPYTILDAAAGFYKMHGAVACITGLSCFILRLSPWQTGAVTFVATVVAYFMSVFAIYPPGLLRVARIYSHITGWGLILIALSVVGIMGAGVIGTGVFWASRLLAEFVTMVHSDYLGRKFLKIVDPDAYTFANQFGFSGAPDGFAVRCFGNAYATYASRFGMPLEAVASKTELEDPQWRTVLKEFVKEWPQVTQHFQVTDEEWEEVWRSGNESH